MCNIHYNLTETEIVFKNQSYSEISSSSSSSTNFIATQVLQKLQGRCVSRVSLVSMVLAAQVFSRTTMHSQVQYLWNYLSITTRELHRAELHLFVSNKNTTRTASHYDDVYNHDNDEHRDGINAHRYYM